MLMESRRSTFYVVLVNLSEGERLTGGMRLDYKWRLPNIAIVAKVINKSMFFLIDLGVLFSWSPKKLKLDC